MPITPRPGGAVQFGIFTVDFRSGELLRKGVKIRLQQQPFQVLEILVKNPGEVLTREDLKKAIWNTETFVDFDMGLDAAIYKLRHALGDSAENPRFVETLPRRGYRFIARVTDVASDVIEPEENRVPGPLAISSLLPEMANTEAVLTEIQESAEKAVVAENRRSQKKSSGWRLALPIWLTVAAAGVLLALGIYWWQLSRSVPGSYVIAVLPLENLSSEPDSAYFSDGLTDEIIRNLSIIDGLQVRSQTSSSIFKKRPLNISEVGSKLGANLVLEGSVFRSGEKLRVDVQLIKVTDDLPLWSGRFDREVKDVFAIQDEISRSIVNGLRLKLGAGQRRYNTDVATYDLFLRAQAMENVDFVRHREDAFKSIDLYQQVVAKDPNFAPAYAGIARVYANLSNSPRSLPTAEVYPRIRAAAEKALELDPLLAEAYDSMGVVHARDREWVEAENKFRRSVTLNPNLASAHVDLAITVLFPQEKFDEAAQELRIAGQIDPLSSRTRDLLNFVLISAGHYDEVLASCRHILADDPSDAFNQQLYGRALLQKGSLSEATAMLEKAGTGSEAFLGYAYTRSGRIAEARQIVERFPEWPWMRLLVDTGLGNKDGAFEALEKMAAIKDPRVCIYLTYPELNLLRSDPRWSAFRRKLGLGGTG